MATINRQIDMAVSLLASRPLVFSARDIADYAGWEGLEDTIEANLRDNESVLTLDESGDSDAVPREYLGMRVVTKWWINHTTRWARAGVDCLTPVQLAHSMSLAFDRRQWRVPPSRLLALGHRLFMIADGSVPGTFVSPWATLLRGDPPLASMFRFIHSSGAHASGSPLTLNTAVDQALDSLPKRDASIIRGRFGIGSLRPTTLEQLGSLHGVSRERVRQIEARALRKLGSRPLSESLWLGLMGDFMQSGGTLIVSESSMTPERRLATISVKQTAAHIPELSLHILGTSEESPAVMAYRNDLRNRDLPTANRKQSQAPAVTFRFLSQADGGRLRLAEEERAQGAVRHTRPQMLLEGLRSLGRAAHYQEIAEECNRLFPERAATVHSWHAALSLPGSEALGIVWIGRKGMYGLGEHGYSRPETDLFDAVAHIVEEVFARTHRPVSGDIVMAELSKQRRELKPSSVVMALGINDRLETVDRDRYVPKASITSPIGVPRSRYDIAAAFRAFRVGGDTESMAD